MDRIINVVVFYSFKKLTTNKWIDSDIFVEYVFGFPVEQKLLGRKKTLERLAEILEDYAYDVKKKNGEDYKELRVKSLWNTTAWLKNSVFSISYFKNYRLAEI